MCFIAFSSHVPYWITQCYSIPSEDGCCCHICGWRVLVPWKDVCFFDVSMLEQVSGTATQNKWWTHQALKRCVFFGLVHFSMRKQVFIIVLGTYCQCLSAESKGSLICCAWGGKRLDQIEASSRNMCKNELNVKEARLAYSLLTWSASDSYLHLPSLSMDACGWVMMKRHLLMMFVFLFQACSSCRKWERWRHSRYCWLLLTACWAHQAAREVWRTGICRWVWFPRQRLNQILQQSTRGKTCLQKSAAVRRQQARRRWSVWPTQCEKFIIHSWIMLQTPIVGCCKRRLNTWIKTMMKCSI